MKTVPLRVVELIRRPARAIAGLIVALGLAGGAANANAGIDDPAISRVDDIRRRLLEADALSGIADAGKRDEESTQVAQRWANWPNWPNWMNWRNWRNW
jgi:hypothetical protein